MKAAIVGATGFIGVPLCHELKQDGWKVTVLARNANSAEKALGPGYNIVSWTPDTDIPKGTLEDADVVINLAGESIGKGRWTDERKRKILESRINTTSKLVDAIKRLDKRPEVLINASAVGYYGPRGDETLCENEKAGNDFLAGVCKAWEEESLKAKRLRVRVVPIRIGVVLGDGGVLRRMITPFKLFAGGSLGSGKQWFSWIHRDDLIGIIKYVARKQSISGPVNATSPRPVTMGEFTKALGRVLHRPSWFPVPGAFLKMGLGEASVMVLKGQRVLPCKLLESGYEFKFESLEGALRDVLIKQRPGKATAVGSGKVSKPGKAKTNVGAKTVAKTNTKAKTSAKTPAKSSVSASGPGKPSKPKKIGAEKPGKSSAAKTTMRKPKTATSKPLSAKLPTKVSSTDKSPKAKAVSTKATKMTGKAAKGNGSTGVKKSAKANSGTKSKKELLGAKGAGDFNKKVRESVEAEFPGSSFVVNEAGKPRDNKRL